MPEHTYFEGGAWNAACDICGRVFKSSLLIQAWDESMRCTRCFETRHPQDFARTVIDDQSVPWSKPWIPPAGVGQWITSGGAVLPWSTSTSSGPLEWIF